MAKPQNAFDSMTHSKSRFNKKDMCTFTKLAIAKSNLVSPNLRTQMTYAIPMVVEIQNKLFPNASHVESTQFSNGPQFHNKV